MQIIFLQVGKTSKSYIAEGIADFSNRIKNYVKFDNKVVVLPKNKMGFTPELKKKEEAKLIKAQLEKSDFLVLLDENGKSLRSLKFADWIQHHLNISTKRIVFVVGGAYGFDAEILALSHMKLSLSTMTFSHQLIRIIFLEQLYRSFTILRNEKYHNE